MSAHDSEKLRITFELCESGERPAVIRYGDHCLKIYRDRIEYGGETKCWKGIMDVKETCKAYALVPLTSNEEKLGRLDHEIKSCEFFKGDNVHFEIIHPKKDKKGETKDYFYVSSSGVAWLGKLGRNGQNPKIREIKSWAEFHEWMTCEQPDEPGS